MKFALVGLLTLAVAGVASAAEVAKEKDIKTGWTIYTVTQGATTVKLAPDAGANVFSIEYQGAQMMKTPKSLGDLPGVGYGVPVLYPTPNRVRGAEFTFGGKTYRFQPNDGTNFIHGLVNSAAWEVAKIERTADQATIHCILPFKPGTKWFERFPLPHVLKLAITVSDGAVRWTYTVDNTQGNQPVPFGFALHPWFLYQGPRAAAFLTVPAEEVMEAEKLLPTGKLLKVAGTKFDARKPTSLEGFVVDDVYYGMTPNKTARAELREKKLAIGIRAGEDFTHLVVYTPLRQGWFCIENQTCSTDAHNLFAKGLAKESHLLVVEPGKTRSDWVEYRFEKLTEPTALFNGRSLDGWRIVDRDEFAQHGEVRVDGGKVLLGRGETMTGISWTGELPKTNYEVSLEAMRTEGSDFFSGLTFPVRDSQCTLIVGGWGGGVVGLSNVDGRHAAENQTTCYRDFEQNRWYRVRLRVTPAEILAWIDDERVIALETKGHTFAIWPQQEPVKPFGIASWCTSAALREITLRRL
ncbi:MAG: aldose epimerase family protein [Pirellulales bacterium]